MNFLDRVGFNDEQKDFYEYWLSEFNNDNFLDVDGNLGYIFIFLYSIIDKIIHDKDINSFLNSINKIEKGYGHYKKVIEYSSIWKIDAYCYVRDYEKALELNIEKGFFLFEAARFAQLIPNEKGNFLNGYDMIDMVYVWKKPKYVESHKDEIAEIGTRFFNQYYEKNGRNIVQFFVEDFNLQNLNKKDFTKLNKLYTNKKKRFQKFKRCYLVRKKDPNLFKTDNIYRHGLFRGVTFQIDPEDIEIEYTPLPDIVMEAMKNEIKKILKECEKSVKKDIEPNFSDFM